MATRWKVPGQFSRIGGGAGLAFVALTLVGGFVQGDVPVYTEGPTAIKEWFSEHSDRYLVGGLLIVLGVLFFLTFVAALVAAFFKAEGAAHSPWPWLVLLAGVHLVVALQASTAFDPTLALLKGDVSGDLARTLSAADYMAFLLVYLFAGLFTLAASVSILATRALWRPLAFLGPLVTVGGLVAASAPLEHDPEGVLTTVGYVTLLAFLVWTAAMDCRDLGVDDPRRREPLKAKERTGRGDHCVRSSALDSHPALRGRGERLLS